jgi:hypothetical protein
MNFRVRKWRGEGAMGRWQPFTMSEGACCAGCDAANNDGFTTPGVLFIEVEKNDQGARAVELRRVEKVNHGWPSILLCKRVSEAEALAEMAGLLIASPSKEDLS